MAHEVTENIFSLHKKTRPCIIVICVTKTHRTVGMKIFLASFLSEVQQILRMIPLIFSQNIRTLSDEATARCISAL